MSSYNQTSKIEIASLADECYKRIKRDILVGTLGWGHRLNVISLAEAYGISRSPVVKAIDRLAMEQLVKIIPNKGSFVLIPTKEDVIEVTEIRLMLETTLCELAYTKNRDKLVSSLKKQNASILKQRGHGEKPQFEAFLEYDRNFHYVLCICADNKRLETYYTSIRCQIELFRTKTYMDQNIEHTINKHLEITKNLETGNLKEALSSVGAHIIEVEEETIQSIAAANVLQDYQ